MRDTLQQWADEVRAEIERRRERRRVIAATTTPPTIQQLQEAYAMVDRERNAAIRERDDLRFRYDTLRQLHEGQAATIREYQTDARARLPSPVELYPTWITLIGTHVFEIDVQRKLEAAMQAKPIRAAFVETFDCIMRSLRDRELTRRNSATGTDGEKKT